MTRMDSDLRNRPQEVCGGCAPLLLDGKATSEVLGIGLSTLYAMDRTGELGPTGVKLRSRRLWPRRELERWVDAGCPHREKWATLRTVWEGP